MANAGWYDDPQGSGRQRWWDGTRWTEHVQAVSVPPPPPQPPPVPPVSEPPSMATAFAAADGWSAPPTRTFPGAIAACFQRYLQFRPRASRSEYWYFNLFTFLVSLPANVTDESTVASLSPGGSLLFLGYLVVLLALIPPGLAVTVRRLHDVDRSAWNLCWALLPVIGWIVLLVYHVRPGTAGPNRYG